MAGGPNREGAKLELADLAWEGVILVVPMLPMY